jgi:hypothetical protein
MDKGVKVLNAACPDNLYNTKFGIKTMEENCEKLRAQRKIPCLLRVEGLQALAFELADT